MDPGVLLDNRYRLCQFIGEGGMSRVYKAEDLKTGTLVALKFLKESITSSSIDDIIRFKKELEIVSRLEHSGIAKVFGSGEYEGALFFVTELLDGESLEQYIQRKEFSDWDEIAGIFYKLGEIIDYIHKNGIIHKDIKPGNFFVIKVENGILFKLLDFGVAHIMELGKIQAEKEIAGTFGYMSPEAAGLFNGNIDERSDLYSLGVIFYQLLTGELPFKAKELGRLLHQQIAAVPVDPGRINKEVPAILEKITMKLLAKDPDSRYQTARGLLYDIDRYIKGDMDFLTGEGDRKDKLTYHTKLVGRKHETEKITGFIRRGQEGKGGLCFISGEAGSGKSRLVEEFRHYAYRRDMLFLEARCLNHENKTPYQPFKDILDGYIGKLEKSGDSVKEKEVRKIMEIAGDFGEILVRLNPRIKRLIGETKALTKLEPDRENQRFLRVLSDFFCGFCEGAAGCILVLEDLQWVDAGSITLLREITGKIGGSRLLVLGTYRDNEVEEEHGIKNIVKEAKKREYPIEEIALENLDKAAVNELAASILGEKTESIGNLTGYLYEKSGGNPLFTVSILRELIENNMVIRNDEGSYKDIDRSRGLKVAENMLNIIINRIGRLDELCGELLCKAAIIGREFEIELLHNLSDCSYEELIEIIDKAVSMQLLEKSPDKRRLLFAHDRIRDAFFNMMGEKERQTVHKVILEALEAMPKDPSSDFAFQLAHHAIEAGEEEKILEYAIPAADKARIAYANEEAIRFYQITQLLLEKRLPGRCKQWSCIAESLIELYLLTGRNDEAILLSERLLSETDKRSGLAGIYKKIGTAYHQKADWERCRKNIIKAMKLLGEAFPEKRTSLAISVIRQAAIYLVNILLYKTPWIPALKDPEEKKQVVWMYETLNWMYVFNDVYTCFYITIAALNLAKRIGVSRELGTCLSNYAAVYMILSLFDRALKHQNKALQIRKEIGDEWGVAKSLQMLGSNYLWKGDYENSIKSLNESEGIFRKIGDTWGNRHGVR